MQLDDSAINTKAPPLGSRGGTWLRAIQSAGIISRLARPFLRTVVSAACLFSVGISHSSAECPDEREIIVGGGSTGDAVEVIALANEGVLLRSGGTTIAIDAAIKKPYLEYGALDRESWTAMLDGSEPFQDLDLLLVSHTHADHFDAAATALLLRRRPNVRVVSSPPVISAIQAALGTVDLRDRLMIVDPPPRTECRWATGDVEIRFLRLRHGGRSWDEMYNLGHVVRLGASSFLHIGDAGNRLENYHPFDLPKASIDVGLLPFWVFFGDEKGLAKTLFGFPQHLAIHVPPADRAEVRSELADSWPNVRVPEPMERVELLDLD